MDRGDDRSNLVCHILCLRARHCLRNRRGTQRFDLVAGNAASTSSWSDLHSPLRHFAANVPACVVTFSYLLCLTFLVVVFASYKLANLFCRPFDLHQSTNHLRRILDDV